MKLNTNWRTALKLLLICLLLLLVYHALSYIIISTGLSRQIEPGAVKGYAYCKVNESSLTNFSRKFPCDFSPPPNRNGPVIVTFVNSAWISLGQNWVCSAKKVGIADYIYLVSFEKGVCSHFPDVKCYEHPNVRVGGTAFGKAGFRILMMERTKVILRFLSCYQQVALIDADISFVKNPLNHLESLLNKKDIVFQADSVGVNFVDSVLPVFFSYICGGFIFMKSNYATKKLWLSVLQYQQNFFWNDQAGLNICIRHHSHSISWVTLDSKYFPSGRQFFFYDKFNANDVMIVHANHLQGVDKHMRMIGSGVWCYEPYAKELCNNLHSFRARCGSGELPNWCKRFASVCQNSYGSHLVV